MKTPDNITITTVIPAYNAGQYIARAIDSVLAQTRPADEIIVVDDGSTDDTAAIVAQYANKVKCIHQQNAGETAARNAGIKAATYDWIAFLDADDEWIPDKLMLQAEALESNPDIVWATSNYYRCLCGEKRKTQQYHPGQADKLLKTKPYFENFFDAFIAEIYGCSDTMIVKKEALIQAGLFNPGQTRAGDMDIWWRIAFHHPKIACVTQPLAVYHLGIPTCASNTFKDWRIYNDMIERNLKIADECGKLVDFTPAAAYILKRWLRAMLFDAEKEGIRSMCKQFRGLLTCPYRTTMYILTICPALTAALCRLISRILRIIPLRRHTVRQPLNKKS